MKTLGYFMNCSDMHPNPEHDDADGDYGEDAMDSTNDWED